MYVSFTTRDFSGKFALFIQQIIQTGPLEVVTDCVRSLTRIWMDYGVARYISDPVDLASGWRPQ